MHKRTTMQEYAPNLEKLACKKRVCAYARVSGDRDEAFHSLSAQVSYYQKKIAEHPDWEFVEVFSDRGITGTKDEREGFQAMLTACREGKVDIVLAKSITRFARNTVILLETIRELKKLGVDVHFEEEHIETLSYSGELLISILAARAQEESRSASENQLWRIKKSYEKGIPVTGNCLGYRMVDHQFLIDEDEEQIVLRIFSMYLSGMGVTAIAKKLTEEKVENRFGRVSWRPSEIWRILRNEKYCGDLKLQKVYVVDYLSKKIMVNHGEKPTYYVKDAHDPIISREDYESVQREIERRASKSKEAKKPTHTVFSGLITCGKCGTHFTRGKNKSGTKYSRITWACKKSNTFGKSFCDMGQRIPEDILIRISNEVLGFTEFSETEFLNRVKEILVPDRNVLIFRFKDGSEKRMTWNYPSKSESWTPEMREAARRRAIAMRRAQKERSKENGFESTD